MNKDNLKFYISSRNLISEERIAGSSEKKEFSDRAKEIFNKIQNKFGCQTENVLKLMSVIIDEPLPPLDSSCNLDLERLPVVQGSLLYTQEIDEENLHIELDTPYWVIEIDDEDSTVGCVTPYREEIIYLPPITNYRLATNEEINEFVDNLTEDDFEFMNILPFF